MSNLLTTQDQEPELIVSGDTVQFTKQLEDYPATDGWLLSYVLNGPEVHTFDATQYSNGILYYVNVAASTTATWAPGIYEVFASVSKNGERFKVRPAFLRITVLANPAFAKNGGSKSSFAEKMLAQIENALLQLGSRTVSSASVNGQSYSLANIGELHKLRIQYQREVMDENAKARLNAGLGAYNKVKIRFGPVGSASPLQSTPYNFR